MSDWISKDRRGLRGCVRGGGGGGNSKFGLGAAPDRHSRAGLLRALLLPHTFYGFMKSADLAIAVLFRLVPILLSTTALALPVHQHQHQHSPTLHWHLVRGLAPTTHLYQYRGSASSAPSVQVGRPVGRGVLYLWKCLTFKSFVLG